MVPENADSFGCLDPGLVPPGSTPHQIALWVRRAAERAERSEAVSDAPFSVGKVPFLTSSAPKEPSEARRPLLLIKVTRLCLVAMPVLILFTQQSARSFLSDADAGLPFSAEQLVIIRKE